MRQPVILLIICNMLFVSGCLLQSKVSSDKALNEISFAQSSIYAYHPNPNYFVDKEYTDSVFQSIVQRLGDQKRISKHELLNELDTYSSSFNDGHMRVSLSMKQQLANFFSKVIPFNVAIIDDQLRVYDSYSSCTKAKRGDIIYSINGKQSKDIVNSMMSRFPSNNDGLKLTELSHYFTNKYWRYLAETPPYHLCIMTMEGDTINEKTRGMRFFRYVRREAEINRERFENTLSSGLGSFMLPEEKKILYYGYIYDTVAYLNIRSLRGTQQESMFYARFFDSIQNAGSTELIIDLRNNRGGRTRNIPEFISYFTGDTVYQVEKISIKLNEQLLNSALNAKENGDSLLFIKFSPYEIGDVLTLLTKEETMIHIPDNPDRFTGEVILLINSSTFSAASFLAAIFKQNNLGTLIGENTGGMLNDFGDGVNLKLPITKSYLTIPVKQIFQAPEDIKDGLSPDMEIKPTIHFASDPDGFIQEIVNTLNK